MSAGYHSSTAASHDRPTVARSSNLILSLVLFLLLSIGTQTASAAVLQSVQSGTAVISDGNASSSVTISSVDLSKSFLVFSVRHNVASPAGGHISGQLTSSTNIDFLRVGTNTDVTVEWTVVQFASGVTVQRGSELLDVTTKNATLTSTDLARSFPIISHRIGGTTVSDDDFARARLTSTTNLELSAYGPRPDSVVEWQVVEYTDAAVQSGDVSFAAGDSTKSVTGLSTFATDKAWLIYSYKSALGTTTNIGQKLVRGLVTGTTSVQFDRSQTGQAIDLTWHLVEFQDDTGVQHANASFTSAQLQADVPIAAVDPDWSFGVGGYMMRGGKSPYNSSDHPGAAWFTAELTSGTNLRLRRDFTGSSTADLGWSVIQFSPGTTISGTVFEDVNYGGGIGRDLATAAADAPSFTVGRGGVTVELYNAGGNLVTSTVTAAGGGYSFTEAPGTYTVRVVNDSVTSSRPGSDGSELAVQTYRIDGVSEAAGDGAKKVGGELPSNENAAANSGAQTLASLQGTDLDSDSITEWTQSIVTVDASGGDVSGVDFGFNFDVVVNTNDSGQGSLRQFIINSNLLAWLGHGQERRIAAVDSLDRWAE